MLYENILNYLFNIYIIMTYLIDKYTPTKVSDFIGNKNAINQLSVWVENLYKDPFTKRAVLLSGRTGIGKTLLANIFFKEINFKLYSFNACDVRSCKSLNDNLEKVIHQKDVEIITDGFNQQRKSIIIMDELDGMGVGDRGGIAELIKFINPYRGKRIKKNSIREVDKKLIPILCINNNIFDKKINDLKKDCFDIQLEKVSNKEIMNFFKNIINQENIDITEELMMSIIINSDSDIRRIFYILQDLYDLKKKIDQDDINKIKINYEKENYDISVYDSTDFILNHSKNEKRINDLFENDRCLIPQMIHENYINNILARDININPISQAYNITKSLYLCDYIDKYIYTNQNWDLQRIQPFFGALFPNYYLNKIGKLQSHPKINFSQCLGKTSLQYTNHKNLELLIHQLNNINYNFDDLRLIYKKIYSLIDNDDKESFIKAKELVKNFDLTQSNLEKLIKINKLDTESDINKIKFLFKN
jgi:replication factor C subunit 1